MTTAPGSSVRRRKTAKNYGLTSAPVTCMRSEGTPGTCRHGALGYATLKGSFAPYTHGAWGHLLHDPIYYRRRDHDLAEDQSILASGVGTPTLKPFARHVHRHHQKTFPSCAASGPQRRHFARGRRK